MHFWYFQFFAPYLTDNLWGVYSVLEGMTQKYYQTCFLGPIDQKSCSKKVTLFYTSSCTLLMERYALAVLLRPNEGSFGSLKCSGISCPCNCSRSTNCWRWNLVACLLVILATATPKGVKLVRNWIQICFCVFQRRGGLSTLQEHFAR